MHPNEKGEFETTHHTDVDTTVKITLEGVTAIGITVVVKTDYVIEK